MNNHNHPHFNLGFLFCWNFTMIQEAFTHSGSYSRIASWMSSRIALNNSPRTSNGETHSPWTPCLTSAEIKHGCTTAIEWCNDCRGIVTLALLSPVFEADNRSKIAYCTQCWERQTALRRAQNSPKSPGIADFHDLLLFTPTCGFAKWRAEKAGWLHDSAQNGHAAKKRDEKYSSRFGMFWHLVASLCNKSQRVTPARLSEEYFRRLAPIEYSRCQLYSVSLSQRKLIPNSALFILPFREFYAWVSTKDGFGAWPAKTHYPRCVGTPIWPAFPSGNASMATLY